MECEITRLEGQLGLAKRQAKTAREESAKNRARAEKAEAAIDKYLQSYTDAEARAHDAEVQVATLRRLGDAMDDAWCVWADKCGIPVVNRYNDPTHAALSDERRAWRRATEAAGKGGE